MKEEEPFEKEGDPPRSTDPDPDPVLHPDSEANLDQQSSLRCGVCLEGKEFSEVDFTCVLCFFYICFDCFFEYLKFNAKKKAKVTCPQCRQVCRNIDEEKLDVGELLKGLKRNSSVDEDDTSYSSSDDTSSDISCHCPACETSSSFEVSSCNCSECQSSDSYTIELSSFDSESISSFSETDSEPDSDYMPSRGVLPELPDLGSEPEEEEEEEEEHSFGNHDWFSSSENSNSTQSSNSG
jgi:hypothetical protein